MKIDGLRAQTEIYKHLTIRDLPKRYAALLFMLFGCWRAGFLTESIVVLILISLLESCNFLAVKSRQSTSESPGKIAIYLTCCVSLGVLYYVPSILLASQSDTALYMLGFLWVLVGIAGTSTMYHAVPVYFWSVTLPGFIVGGYLLFGSVGVSLVESSWRNWALPIGLFGIHVVNTARMIWDFRDTHRELEESRTESLARLRRLTRREFQSHACRSTFPQSD